MSTGNLQLCGGQKSGAEIAIRAATELFEDDASHGIQTTMQTTHLIPSTGK